MNNEMIKSKIRGWAGPLMIITFLSLMGLIVYWMVWKKEMRSITWINDIINTQNIKAGRMVGRPFTFTVGTETKEIGWTRRGEVRVRNYVQPSIIYIPAIVRHEMNPAALPPPTTNAVSTNAPAKKRGWFN